MKVILWQGRRLGALDSWHLHHKHSGRFGSVKDAESYLKRKKINKDRLTYKNEGDRMSIVVSPY